MTDGLTLRDRVEILHKLRLTAIEARENIDRLNLEFIRDNQAALDASSKACEAVQKAEDEIRAEAVKLYEANPSTKEIAPGVTIIEKKSYDWPIEKRWPYVEQFAPNCITPASVNEKAWLELCKSDVLRPPFVNEVLAPQARIATDLGAALAKEAV